MKRTVIYVLTPQKATTESLSGKDFSENRQAFVIPKSLCNTQKNYTSKPAKICRG